jgi:hypothetical protein
MTSSDRSAAPVRRGPAWAAGRLRRRIGVSAVLVVALGGALLAAAPADASTCSPKVSSAACNSTGHGAKPVPKKNPTWLVKYRVWTNHIKIYKNGELVRDVPVAGNPYLSPQLPSTCHIAQKLRVNWDKTLVWRLDYFTRLCAGRGVGAHAIPINRYTGAPSMTPSGLGHTPGVGSPVSHGCARMLLRDAKWIYNNVPLGTTVKISYAR